MAALSPLDILFDELEADLQRDESGPNCRALMEEYMARNTDWKEYVFFNVHKYARNLVKANDLLELMVICWSQDQVSQVHNHASQRCWAGILSGTMRESHYRYKNSEMTEGEGELEEFYSQDVHAGRFLQILSMDRIDPHAPIGSVSYIDDLIALHTFGPVGGPGVTLHLYSKPIKQCNIYDPNTGTISLRNPRFYTIDRQIQPDFIDVQGGKVEVDDIPQEEGEVVDP